MASMHHPLLGDKVYGPQKCPFPELQGQTLHAKILGIVHPRTGEYLEVDAPLPEYFEKILQKFPGMCGGCHCRYGIGAAGSFYPAFERNRYETGKRFGDSIL